MKRSYIVLVFLILFIFGCATTGPPPKTQLQIREFQTRSYETNDVKMVMKAMLNVLQDDGFIAKNANVDLGLITATKEIDLESKGEAFFLTLLAGRDARWKKNSIIECSSNISELGKLTRVRINFQMKVMNNKGEVVDVKQIEDPTFYEEFFSKVDKGIFIEKEIYQSKGSEKKKTNIYSFEEIKEWHNALKDREWKKISESEGITHCYDTRNISYLSKGIVRVYTLATYESKNSINDKINHYRQLGLSTKGYENLYGTVTLQEINCTNKMYLPIFFMDYEKNRNPLNQSYDLSSNGWSEISSTMPMLEKLYKVVCPGVK
jgi:hypothetical protein